MKRGKQTCKILKEIRKQIAEENGIELVVSECTYHGDCLGTCPKCEAEVRYLEHELEKRQRMGKVAVVAGLSVGLLGASQVALAQTPDSLRMDTIEDVEVVESDGEVFGCIQETRPSFRGGERKLLEFIGNNVVYPKEAIDAGIEGKVFVEFYIEKDGTVCDAKVLRGIGYGCDEEALRVIGLMPKWSPGMQRGKAVRVRYTLPINFKLSKEKSWQKANKPASDTMDVAPEVGYVVPFGQESDLENDVYMIVEQMPEFPGGYEAMMQYVADHVKYPEVAKKAGCQGRVYVGFIVEPDGSLSEFKVLRGIGYGCDEEAVRVAQSMPKWKPGMHNGEFVRVFYQIPIHFKSEDD